MAQQWQLTHEDRILELSKDISCKQHHLGGMYYNPKYWYKFHYDPADINMCLKLEIDLLKQVSRGEIPLGMCIAKTRTILQEYHCKTGRFHDPMLTREELHEVHQPWTGIPKINDDTYLCTPTLLAGRLFTNELGGPPDWVVLQEGDQDVMRARR